MTMIIGHRGDAKYYPENTMPGFISAYDKGADMIEFDVHLTKDEEIVIIHDDICDRTSNLKGQVCSYTLSEIKNGDFGSWFDSSFKNTKIPTLVELLEYFKETELEFNVEIKSTLFNLGKIEKMVLELFEKYDMKKRMYISSFNHYALRALYELDKSIRCGYLYHAKLYEPVHYAKRVSAYSLNPYYLTLDAQMIKACKNSDIKVFPYTVDDKNIMLKLIKEEVDGIITNDPKMLCDLLK